MSTMKPAKAEGINRGPPCSFHNDEKGSYSNNAISNGVCKTIELNHCLLKKRIENCKFNNANNPEWLKSLKVRKLGSHEIFYDFTSAYIFGFSLWNWVLFCFSCFNLCLILISEALLISSTLDFLKKINCRFYGI